MPIWTVRHYTLSGHSTKMKYYIAPPPMNPLSRFLTALFAVLVLAGAFFFGLAVLAVLVASFSVFALVIYVRAWWLGRKRGATRPHRSRTASDETVIDAEYTVVSRRQND